MAKKLHILVGTLKGLFIFDGDEGRESWTRRGPFCEAWPILHAIADPVTGMIFAGGGNAWFGPAVWQSKDIGTTWTHSSEGLAYREGVEAVQSVWSLNASHGHLFAGVQPAGLFKSSDGGKSWTHLEGLQKNSTRKDWMPGGAGLILHHIVPHPDDPDRLWIAISAAGVFYSDDGGETWVPRNKGTRSDFLPEDQRYPEVGQCVHALTMAAGNPERLFQQNHCGMYVTENGGEDWTSIEEGLPSSFGFPAVAHPRDPDTLFLLPLNGDSVGRFVPDGRAAVWRTRDGGKSWSDLRKGLPQEGAFFGVLRQAMATDTLSSTGVYFGTSSGSVYASANDGDQWTRIAEHLPTITSVETLVTES